MADAIKLKPADGMVALQFLDDDEECKNCEGDGPLCEKCECCSKCCKCQGGPEYDDEAECAVVVGVGANVKGVKDGATVVVTPWARRDGVRIGDIRIVSSYSIKATVGK